MTLSCLIALVVQTESADDVLGVLISVILFASLAAFVSASAAIFLRMRHILHGRRVQNIQAAWMPRILSLVVAPVDSDDAFPNAATLLRDVRALSEKKQRALLELIVRFAFIVTGSAQSRLCRLAEPALPAAQALLKRRDPALRALGVHIIGRLGLGDNEQLVLTALSDPSPVVSKTAARALARSGRCDYVEPILKTAERLTNWGTSEIVSVLQEIGPAAQPILRDVFANRNRSAAIRVICAETLRWLNDLTAAAAAVEILRHESDCELLAASLRLLRRVGTTEHTPAARHLCRSHDPVVRLNAIATLAATTSDSNSDDVGLLGTALADPSSWVAIRAARGLRELDRPEPLQNMLALNHQRANLVRDVWPELEMQLHRHAA